MNDVTQPARGRRTMPSMVAAFAALVALLAFVPLASATSDPLASGTTKITFNKGLFNKLKKNGVKVLKVSPGTLKGRTASLPVSGGAVDPTTGQGTVEHSGGIKFKRGKKSAAVNTLVLDTTTSSLNAKVAGKKMKLASVSGVTIARNGFGLNVTIGKLKLTGKAAQQLNKKLNIVTKTKGKGKAKGKASASKGPAANNLFKGNQVLGSSASETQPKTVAVLPSGTASLKTDEATVKKFEEMPPNGNLVKIEPAPPTTVTPGPSPFAPILGFPISGGTIAPDASSGTVQTSGGVRLVQDFTAIEKGKTTMTLGNIWVDLSAKTASAEVLVESTVDPKANLGNLGRVSIADLSLTGAVVKSDSAARTVTVENATATLQEVTAETLNGLFGTAWDTIPLPHPKFAKGDPLGSFSFTVQTQ